MINKLNKITALQEELKAALKTAQEANEAKSKFVVNISHEMRTPLNAVIGLSALALDIDGLDEEAAEYLEKIHDSGINLLNIVNDILDVSKMETGVFELIADEYDTPSLINDVITQNLLYLRDKPVELELTLDEDIPAHLYGDGLRVKQIVSNLLSNAFKYTNEGTVRLSIKCYKEAGDVWLIISVRDTGIGIREEDLPVILTDYVRLNTDSNWTITGTGLGLPITKHLIGMMDGSLNIESEYGKGSVFTAKIRQRFVSDATIDHNTADSLKKFRYVTSKRERNMRRPESQIPNVKVLVVDDVITNLDVAKGLLKPYNIQTDCVTSGQRAIDMIRADETRYSAIFMDHMMPDMDGIETARLIREIGTQYAQSIPIIAFTANAVIGNEQMFLNLGFQDFVSKPIDIARLDRVIKRWLKCRSEDESPESSAQADGPSTDGPSSDGPSSDGFKRASRIMGWKIDGLVIPACIEHFGGNEELFLDILQSFADNTPSLIERAKSVCEDDLSAYIIALHGIKGSCRTIVAYNLAAGAEALEAAAATGDIEYIHNNNESFLRDMAKFVLEIKNALAGINVIKR